MTEETGDMDPVCRMIMSSFRLKCEIRTPTTSVVG